ncbi:MAG: amidohydrolase family protein [Burkholderiales bacterium]
MKVIDVHTHMLNDGYLRLLKRNGGGYTVKKVVGGQMGIHKDGAPFMTLTPGMFDYDLRIRAMDKAGVDIAIVSLTSPNVFWGSGRQSLEAARLVNDDMAAQQRRYPDRIRFLCSLPWQHAKLAVAELKRACDELGAVGVMQMASVDGVSLTDPAFAPVWREIDRRALPVLIHPLGRSTRRWRRTDLAEGHQQRYPAGELPILFSVSSDALTPSSFAHTAAAAPPYLLGCPSERDNDARVRGGLAAPSPRPLTGR